MTTSLPPPDAFHIDPRTGRPRFHFDGGADGAAAAAAAAAQKPWHDGVEPEVLGHWDNKGWDKSDPKAIALAATKQAREAERHFGVPIDRLLKLPDAAAKPEEWAAVYQRLGAPKEAKEYDFAGIKFAGEDLDPGFADAMRASLAAAFVPKDKATAIVQGVVKYLESAEASEATVTAGKIAEEKASLAKNWGPKFDFNHLQAMEGAKRAGVSPEAVKALEGQVGYANVMELFRRIGASGAESVFVEGGGGDGAASTRNGALARLAELEGDKAWGKRFKAGDAAAKAEWNGLMAQINDEAA